MSTTELWLIWELRNVWMWRRCARFWSGGTVLGCWIITAGMVQRVKWLRPLFGLKVWPQYIPNKTL